MAPDYSGQNLRGRSFKGQNLAGANFSYADIRSTNFTGANLKGANFTGAKAGLQKRWALLLVLFLVVLSFLMQLFLGFFLLPYTGLIILYIILNQELRLSLALVFVLAFAIYIAPIAVQIVIFGIEVLTEVAIQTAISIPIDIAIAYIAWQAMKGDEKYALVRNVAVAFAAIGGTSFRDANLTDANFTSAQLKSTDLRQAELARTCFHKTKLLDRVRPGSSYLKHPEIRQLILTGQGQNKDFHRLYLRGINLKKALLTDASFTGTDLSEACLQDADLSRAKLVKTQLRNTDFTGANLTGAYIEDWNITHKTNFRNVRCEYVYMRCPTKENPNPLRKPDNNNEVFK